MECGLDPVARVHAFLWVNVLFCKGCHNEVLQTGGLDSRNILSHGSGDWESETKLLAGLAPPEGREDLFQASVCGL